jgi:hypothetical protein
MRLVITTDTNFWEYARVLRYSEQEPLLRALDRIRTDEATAADLIGYLTAHHGLPPVEVRFTGRDRTGQRGWYHGEYLAPHIILTPRPKTEAVVHEAAHHWVEMDNRRTTPNRRTPSHNWDFTWRLDRLAVTAADWLEGEGIDVGR